MSESRAQHVSDDVLGSIKMMRVLGELIYTEYQYLQDMKDMIGYLEQLRDAGPLNQTEKELIQKYIEMGQVLAEKSVLLEKVPDAPRIYDLIQKKFDELGIPPNERRERIQDALQALAEDKSLTGDLYKQVVAAFQDDDVKDYIKSFEPIIATYKAFGEFVVGLSEKYPLDPVLVKKLSGNESYPIKPTQRLAKYQLHVQQIRDEIPLTPELKDEFEKFKKSDPTLEDKEISAKRVELRKRLIEAAETDQLYSDTKDIIAEVNNEKKSATAQDIRVYFFMKEMKSRYEQWEELYPGQEHKAFFSDIYQNLDVQRQAYQNLQVPTLDQIKDRVAKETNVSNLTPNQKLLKEALEKRKEMETKLQEDPENKKYRAVETEINSVIGKLAKLVSIEETQSQLNSLENIFQALSSLPGVQGVDGTQGLFTQPELDAISHSFESTRQELAREHEATELLYVKAVREMEQVSHKRLGRSERKSFLDTTISPVIQSSKDFDVIVHMREMVGREDQQIRDIKGRVDIVINTPQQDNTVAAHLQVLKDGKNKEPEGVMYNKWVQFKQVDPQDGTWSKQYHDVLTSHKPFMDKVDEMKSTVEQSVILKAQIHRVQELRNALSITAGNKRALLENYNKSPRMKKMVDEYIKQVATERAKAFLAEKKVSPDDKKYQKMLKKQIKIQQEKLTKDIDRTLKDIGTDKIETELFALLNQQEKELNAQLDAAQQKIQSLNQELTQIARDRISDPNVSLSGKKLDPVEKKDLLFENTKAELMQVQSELSTRLNDYKLARDKKQIKTRDGMEEQLKKIEALLIEINRIQNDTSLGAREQMKQLKNAVLAAKLRDSDQLKDIRKGFEGSYNTMKEDYKRQRFEVDKELTHIAKDPGPVASVKMLPFREGLKARIDAKQKSYEATVTALDKRQELVKEKAHTENASMRAAYKMAEEQMKGISYSLKKIQEDPGIKLESERLKKCLQAINRVLENQKTGVFTPPLPRDTVNMLKEMSKSTEREMKKALAQEKKQQKVEKKQEEKLQKQQAKAGTRVSIWRNPSSVFKPSLAGQTRHSAPKQGQEDDKKEISYRGPKGRGGFND